MIWKNEQKRKERGSTIFLSSILGATVLFISGAALLICSGEQSFTKSQSKKLVSRYVAEAGLAKAVKVINNSYIGNEMNFAKIDDELNDKTILNNEDFYAGGYKLGRLNSIAKVLTNNDINTGGKDITGTTMDSIRWILLDTKGYDNSPQGKETKTTFNAIYEMSHGTAEVFDYSYFVNNWGWFYGNNIVSQGNVRSNGAFSFGSYRPQIWGKPRFETSNGIDLIGYIDDNWDGQKNNQDGGVYAWDTITGNPSSTGHPKDLYAGLRDKNTKPSVPMLPMPNLTNLGMYEKIATDNGSYIKIGNDLVCDGIWGDNEGKEHLYLEGTIDTPIEIKGTVVVRGDLIIRGYYTGQGAIYCGRNIYLPQRVIAKNGVSNKQPSTNSEASRENWRERNQDADLLGLFAREHIVLSDYTNGTWQSKVNEWIVHPANSSKEDAGIDKIPNTGDQGENDNTFTIEKDSHDNPIPGTGEDIDGDGIYDNRTQIFDFYLESITFTSNHSAWGGNIPANVTKFKDITYWDDEENKPAVGTQTTITTTDKHGNTTTTTYNNSKNFPEVHAVLYTNHFLGGYVFNKDGYNYQDDTSKIQKNTGNIVFFGAVICRNESIIYEANKIYFYHEERISADSGKRFNLILPRVWKPLKLIAIDIE